MKKTLLSLLLLGAAVPALSQPLCHPDGTVTFCYRNDHAREVMVDVQFAGRHAMTRHPQTGLWTATLGPAAPDLYPYCFVVDGMSVMDPQCDAYFPNEGFKNSIVEIPSADPLPLAHDIRPVPHGRVDYVSYYSQSLGATNHAVVCLPPGYQSDSQKRYPVFYLISGTTDTEEVYYKVGRVNYILDNLLAEGAAREMIVVLPYGNPLKLLPQVPDEAGVPQTRFGGDVFSRDLNDDLMPYIEQHYRTIADRDHRAIGGFSRGGNQALYNGLTHLDKFAYLCSYSSFTSTDIPGVYDHARQTNSRLRLFWLGVGTDDFLYGNARDYMAFLDKKGIRAVKEFTHDKFGHTWMNARFFLDKTLRLLFNPEAAEAAMRGAQPAPAATGHEPQFTPGVMARLFPRPVISPEYLPQGIVLRMKADSARSVSFVGEQSPQPMPMQKDADGVWTLTLPAPGQDAAAWRPFTYYFLVDGTPVTDPNNMHLSPAKGFKPSVACHPAWRYHCAAMADMPHGTTSYDPDTGYAWHTPPHAAAAPPAVVVELVPGSADTAESWFKVAHADDMADRLAAEGKAAPCLLTTCPVETLRQQGLLRHDIRTFRLRADDYPTWSQRSKALEELLVATSR